MKKYSDVPKSNFAGYPKTIYDDGETKLEIWKFKGDFAEFSQMILLIPNGLISTGESGAIKVKMNGDDCVCIKPPRKMNPMLKASLYDKRFEMDGDDDILPTDEYLVIRLGDSLAFDLAGLFNENGVGYNKELLNQYINDRGVEEDKFKKAIFAMNATRPTHGNIAIIKTKLKELKNYIENIQVDDGKEDSYDEEVERLVDPKGLFFEEIYYLIEEIHQDGHGTEEEADAVEDIQRRIKELDKMRRDKLDEIGYEG